MNAWNAVFTGLAGLAALWVILGLASSFSLKALVTGTDKTLSTSKLQLMMWTVVLVFGYLVLFAFHAKAANFADLGLPTNVLIAVGISVTTAVAAKAVAVNNAATPVPPPPPDPADVADVAALNPVPAIVLATPVASRAGIFQADDGSPDLGKVQLMVWTLIAVCIYLVKIHHQLATNVRQMPDIDQTLMILMGLGHGAYLGKKIAAGSGS